MKRLTALGMALIAPCAFAAPAAPSDACMRIAADQAQVQQARQHALEKRDSAWKAVLPFAVIARKVSSKAAVEEADRQVAALRRAAEAEGCDPPGDKDQLPPAAAHDPLQPTE
jgi:hypothetical protein